MNNDFEKDINEAAGTDIDTTSEHIPGVADENTDPTENVSPKKISEESVCVEVVSAEVVSAEVADNGAATDALQDSSDVAPESADTNEIIYDKNHEDTTKEGFGWSYVEHSQKPEDTPAVTEAPSLKKKQDSYGLKVFALIIAAVFTLSFTCLSSFIVLDSLGIIGKTTTNSEAPVQGSTKIPQNNSSVETILKLPEPSDDGTGVLTVTQIAEKCTPSSVGILVEFERQSYFGTYTSSGVGSGFILSDDGYIATNNHVVADASKIVVVLNDENQTEYEATLIGTDAVTDIAVIKIEATGLPVAELGNSDNVVVGDLAVAIGTPASIELAGTVTDGIISAVDRQIDITDSYGRVQKTMTLIQTNATINPGNSGGPLINNRGQVIGINTLKLTDEFEGIGFAIPINGAINVINQLITDGVVSDRGESFVTGSVSIGIQGTAISESEAEYYGVPQGVLVIQLDKNNTSAKAGLKRGDIITKFDGVEVKTVEEIIELKSKYKVGDEVTLTVYRDGELDITFNLDAQQ